MSGIHFKVTFKAAQSFQRVKHRFGVSAVKVSSAAAAFEKRISCEKRAAAPDSDAALRMTRGSHYLKIQMPLSGNA